MEGKGWICHLFKHVTTQSLVQQGSAVDEFKQVHPAAMFLHHHLDKVNVLVHIKNLQGKNRTDK